MPSDRISQVSWALSAPALIARERHENGYQTKVLSIKEINDLTFDSKLARCQGCLNHCLLTINRFSGGRQYITGNRCEKGLGKEKNSENIPNLFDYKNKRIFDYEPLTAEAAPRGTVGIPRVLNMYENYPFWATFFTALNFRVVLSPQSTEKYMKWVSTAFRVNRSVTPRSWRTDMLRG